MRRFQWIVFGMLIWFLPGWWGRAQAQDTAKVEITSPTSGEALRGQVAIQGNTNVEGFISWELTFGYSQDTTGSWFLIAEGSQPVRDGLLTEWDTTMITDGNYQVRLTVFLEGERRTHFVASDIRVRNYTTIETLTPTPILTATPYTLTLQPSPTPSPSQPPSQTPVPMTPTALPTNPIVISAVEINTSWLRGALGSLALFLLMGLYLSIKTSIQRSKGGK